MICGMVRERANAQDTGDVDRFGPLRSVIPYSCVLVDLCMKKLQRAGEPESSNSLHPSPFLVPNPASFVLPPPKWAWSSFYISRGYHIYHFYLPFFWVGTHPTLTKTWLVPSSDTGITLSSLINGRRFAMAAVRMTLRWDGSYQPPLRRKQVQRGSTVVCR